MSYGNYPDLTTVRKILVIKMRHHGDVLLTSPLFTFLKQQLPEALIDAYLYRDTQPMLSGLSAINDFILYDRSWKKLPLYARLAHEWRLLYSVRAKKYDLIINLTEGDRGAIVAAMSGAAIRIGFDPEGQGFFRKKKIYTHLIKNCKTPRHAVERNLDALRRIGLFPQPADRKVSIVISEEETMQTIEMVPQDYILIHPVSRWKFKCWPVKRVAALIASLHADGHNIVLTASQDLSEMQMAEEIIRLAVGVPVINLAGKTTLKQLAALILKSKAVICVDSVPLHICSATQTPVVVLFGPTSEKNWGPWMHPQARVVTEAIPCRPCLLDGCGGSKKSDCLERISVEKVREALYQLLPETKTLDSVLQNIL